MKIAIMSNNGANTGYGIASKGMSDILSYMKISGNYNIDSVEVVNSLSKENLDSFKGADVILVHMHPDTFMHSNPLLGNIIGALSKCKRRYLIVVWETDSIPKRWIPLLKGNIFNGFLAPSVFVYNLIMKACDNDLGDKNIFYYPHFISWKEESRVIDKSKFRILFVGQHTERKGLDDAIKAVSRCFGNNKDVEFLIKYNQLSNYELSPSSFIPTRVRTNTVGEIKMSVFTNHNSVSDVVMDNMYKTADLLIFPSKGEGFGLPPCMSMSYGVPVLYVPWSATEETCDHDYNYKTDYLIDEADSMVQYGYERGSRYAKPSIYSIMDKLEMAYADYTMYSEKELLERGLSLKKFIEERYGVELITKCIKTIIDNDTSSISKLFEYTNKYFRK